MFKDFAKVANFYRIWSHWKDRMAKYVVDCPPFPEWSGIQVVSNLRLFSHSDSGKCPNDAAFSRLFVSFCLGFFTPQSQEVH